MDHEGAQEKAHCCHEDKERAKILVKDPVCGMDVDPATAAGSIVHEGHPFHFCSQHCLEKFRSDPAQFTPGGARA